MKVNCEALEAWQGSHGETRHAGAEPWGGRGARPGRSVRAREGPAPPRGHFSLKFLPSDIAEEMHSTQEVLVSPHRV